MRRYAFIDVPNTIRTTRDCLDFQVDWKKLETFLSSSKWKCSKIFFYKGHKGNNERKQLEKIAKMGYEVRTKLTHVHPDTLRNISVRCPDCGGTFIHTQRVRGSRKSNCDVELTVDAVENLQSGDEAILFTGDGDFAFLVETLIEKGVVVWIVSSKHRSITDCQIRFSTRLSRILEREERAGDPRFKFIHINNWKQIIGK